MNKRLLNVLEKIQGNQTIMEVAEKCYIRPTTLQNILLEKTKNKLSLEEIQRIWGNYEYKFSLNELLQIFNYNNRTDIIVRGEIYWVDFGEGKGSIQGGIRPAVITCNNMNNKFCPTINVAPITSSINKKNIPSHVQIEGCGLDKPSTILIEQTRTVNKTDLKGFIGYCDIDTLNKLDNAIKIQFDTKEQNNKFSMDDFLKYFISRQKLKDPTRLSNALMKEYNTFCQLG
jgi:mRNA interferase MazF